jgi:hypothetical protein
MASDPTISYSLDEDGFAIREGVLSNGVIAELLVALNQISASSSVRKRGGIFAIRNLLDECVDVRDLATSPTVQALVEPVLGPKFFPVRGILFDKIPDANWKVPWHQDLTIAVQEKIEVEGFGPWSIKAEVLHVQPPRHILENMLTVRFHLDRCDQTNGALRVVPGSHRLGRIPEADIASILKESTEHICSVGAGGALVMRPLLLHASSPSVVPGHRRVVHLDFASVPLPGGLRWFSQSAHMMV